MYTLLELNINSPEDAMYGDKETGVYYKVEENTVFHYIEGDWVNSTLSARALFTRFDENILAYFIEDEEKFYTVETYEAWEHHFPVGYYRNRHDAERALDTCIASEGDDYGDYFSFGIDVHEFEESYCGS